MTMHVTLTYSFDVPDQYGDPVLTGEYVFEEYRTEPRLLRRLPDELADHHENLHVNLRLANRDEVRESYWDKFNGDWYRI